MSDASKLAIVTQDPANYGGVLRLVQYIYSRTEAIGFEPLILHYGRFAEHPELSASMLSVLRGELHLSAREKAYEFQGMRSLAFGAVLPEWEPNRIRSTPGWKRALQACSGAILVTGSAHTGLPLAENNRSFTAWISSTVEDDRRERLAKERGVAAHLERASLPAICSAEKAVLSVASRTLVVSDDAAARVRNLGLASPEVWPYPIDTSRFHPTSSKSSAVQFLFVGRANDPRKRYTLFLRACEELQRAHPDLLFTAVVVSSELPEHPASLNLVHYSRVDEQRLIDLYSSSTALVLTSEQEGLGIAAMEAMACELPVISTRCGGPETYIGEGVSGCFVEADASAIADAMYRIADQELNAAIRRNARARIVEQFSETVWNEKFDQMLRECIER